MSEYLLSGPDVLKKYPGFRLIGRADYFTDLCCILTQSSANSVIASGPGGVGISALALNLQACKADPNAPFDIVSKRLFWLDTDSLFGLGDATAIDKELKAILSILARTPESVLIVEDTIDLIEALRNFNMMHVINALNALVKSGRTQAFLEVREKDLGEVYKAHSDFREHYTLFDLTEPAGSELFDIVTALAMNLEKAYSIKIDSRAVKVAIDLSNRYRSLDTGLNSAQPERSRLLLDRAMSKYALMAHSTVPKLAELEAALAKDPTNQTIVQQIETQKTAFSEKQNKIKEYFAAQRSGERAILVLEAEIAELVAKEKTNVDANKGNSKKFDLAEFSLIQGGAGFSTPEIDEKRAKVQALEAAVADNLRKYQAITNEINASLCLTDDWVIREFSRISGIEEAKLRQDDTVKLVNLGTVLKGRVFGQDNVLEYIWRRVKIWKRGRRTNKPLPFMLCGPSGVGKAQPLFSKVLTPYGWTNMGNIVTGSKVVTPNGDAADVIGVYPQGNRMIYRVTFWDGRQAECCDEHLWTVHNNDWSEKTRVVPLHEIRRLLNTTKQKLHIPLMAPVTYTDRQPLPIHPYVIGAFIGDGNFSGKILRISSADQEIRDRIANLLPDKTKLTHYDSSAECDWNVIGQQFIIPQFRKLGLVDGMTSEFKVIPQEYLYASVEDRYELLRGLLDTDGTVGAHGAISFSTSSLSLASNVMELVRSLGGICKLGHKWPAYTYKGEKKQGKESFRLSIRHPEPHKLFSLSRKIARTPANYQYADRLRLRITRVEMVGEYECQCIMVDHPDHSYITDDFTVTHNTEICRALAEGMFDTDQALNKFDMGDYGEKNDINKLIGAPPGYEGFDVGGQMTNSIRTNPYQVMLQDEIEKAHADIFNTYLGVLDNGYCKDNIGRRCEFGDAIMPFTTNIGQAAMLRVGQITEEEAYEETMRDLEKFFKPEFLNRFEGRENIIILKSLQIDAIQRIAIRELSRINEFFAPRIQASFPSEQLNQFCVAAYTPKVGARGIPGKIKAIEGFIVDRTLEDTSFSGIANVAFDRTTTALAVSWS